MIRLIASVAMLAGSCISSFAITKSCKELRKKLNDRSKGTEKADHLCGVLADIAQELGYLMFTANMVLIWIYLQMP